MKKHLLIIGLLMSLCSFGQDIRIAKLKYRGGGDWYANKTALPNLISFCNQNMGTSIAREEDIVEVFSPDLFLYPYVYMTGHGNVVFSDEDAENLRNYLQSGGFLHIDDNYGLDPFIRVEIKKIFPNKDFVEIPFDHPIYHQKYDFEDGPPKIHEHDGKPAQGFGIFIDGRLVCYYTYECDLGNGWEDQSIYNDPQEVRIRALKMGANILSYVFTTEQ
ncbi:DUF4159 domain-containing protein [Marinoscillum sp. MHG1-6]|uniref:DUF4159 domain-containing protein n=1 Tax=Marinoscillum sp. MHG1-6 TaxID=2959627 RepID=UPI0021582DFA|nr:DUF4159 domain-containing protein [Marinoscillum sp. MHG1-6]